MNDPYTYGQAEEPPRLDDSMFWRWRFVFWLHGAGYDSAWSNHYGAMGIIPANSPPGTVPYTFTPAVDRMKKIVFESGREFLTELSNYFTEQAVDSLP